MPGFSIGIGQHLLSVGTFILTLVFVSHLVRERRSPGSAAAWLLAIVLVPYVGIPLYLFLRKRKLTVPHPKTQAGKRNGNTVRLVSSGVDAFALLLKMIDAAESEIQIEAFILGRDEVASEIVEHLERKARTGVKVRFLLDAFGVFFTNHARLKRLKAAGAEVASFQPLLSNLRNHRKIVIIDHVWALTGGMNLAREYMGPVASSERWKDLALELRGPAVGDLEAIFRADWKFATGESLPEVASVAALAAGDSLVQVMASGPDVVTDSIYDGLLTAIFQARRRIWIATPYFIPDETLTRALEIACRRGVDVRVLVPRRSNHVLADVGRGSYIRQIEEQEATILLHPKMVHAKATLIDDSYAIVGSANTDMRSFFFNFEACVFLYEKADVEALSEWYERLAAECQRGYPRAPAGFQTLEGVSRILSPLL